MSEEQIEALKGLVREIVRDEIREMTRDIAYEYEFGYERDNKIEDFERTLRESGA